MHLKEPKMTHDEFMRLNLIQEYLDGALTGKGLTNFRHLRRNDPGFEQDVILLKKIHQAFSPENEQVNELRHILTEIERENKAQHFAKKRMIRIQWILLTASIVIVLVSMMYCFLQETAPMPKTPTVIHIAQFPSG